MESTEVRRPGAAGGTSPPGSAELGAELVELPHEASNELLLPVADAEESGSEGGGGGTAGPSAAQRIRQGSMPYSLGASSDHTRDVFGVLLRGGVKESPKPAFIYEESFPKWRLAIRRVVAESQWFERAILAVVLLNCISMSINSGAARHIDTACFVVYVLEVFLKLAAMGFFQIPPWGGSAESEVPPHTGAYFRSWWNVSDFAITLLCGASLVYGSSFAGLRAFRIIRLLRAVSFSDVRILVNALLASLPKLVDVIALYLAFIFVLAIIATQLWKGLLRYRCVGDAAVAFMQDPPSLGTAFEEERDAHPDLYGSAAESYLGLRAFLQAAVPPEALEAYFPTVLQGVVCNPDASELGGFHCAWGMQCVDVGNPGHGMLSYDNIFVSTLSLFVAVTLEGWSDLMNKTIDGSADLPVVFFFFAFLIAFGSFFIINLTLVITTYAFEAQHQRERRAQQESRRQKNLRKIQKLNMGEVPPEGVVPAGHTKTWRNRVKAWWQAVRLAGTSRSLTQGMPCEIFHRGDWILGVAGEISIPQSSISFGRADPTQGDSAAPIIRVYCEDGRILTATRLKDVKPLPIGIRPLRVRQAIRSKPFLGVVIATIVLNTICLSLDHQGESESLNEILTVANFVFCGIFALEMVVKMYGFGFAGYFHNVWNAFDAAVVAISVADIALNHTAGASVLRALRILRFFKLAHHSSHIRKWVLVIIRSLRETAVLAGILLLLVCGYTVVGMQFMSGRFCTITPPHPTPGCSPTSPDDCACQPRQNFDNFGSGFLSMFQVLTGDSWSTVMYDGMRSVSLGESASSSWWKQAFMATFFVSFFCVGHYLLLNAFVAIMLHQSGVAEMEAQAAEQQEEDDLLLMAAGDLASAAEAGQPQHPRPFEAASLSRGVSDDGGAAHSDSNSLLAGRTASASASRRKRGGRNPRHRGSNAVKFLGGNRHGEAQASPSLAGSFGSADGLFCGDSADGAEMVGEPHLSFRRQFSSAAAGQQHHRYSPPPPGQRKDSRTSAAVAAQRINSTVTFATSAASVGCASASSASATASPTHGASASPSSLPSGSPLRAPHAAAAGSPSAALGRSDGSPAGMWDTSPCDSGRGRGGGAGSSPAPPGRFVGGNSPSSFCEKTEPLLGAMEGAAWGVTQQGDGDMGCDDAEEGVGAPPPEERAFFCVAPENPVRRVCLAVVQHPVFEWGVLLLILVSTASLCAYKPMQPPDSLRNGVLAEVDLAIAILFAVEFALKVVAFGFILHPTSYIRRGGDLGWNLVDFSIVVASLASLAVGPSLAFFRILRVLRPLRFINRSSGMRIVFQAVIRSVPALGNVLAVTLLVWAMWAIMGVQLFSGKFYACTATHWGDVAYEVREAEGRSFDLSYRNDCLAYPEAELAWETYPSNFDNVGEGLLALFHVASLEGWVVLLHLGMDGVGYDRAPQRDHSPYIAAVFFVVFVFVGAFFVVNLFISVLLDTYYIEDRRRANASSLLTDQQKKWVQSYRELLRGVSKPPDFFYDDTAGCVVRICRAIVGWKKFEPLVQGVIVLNLVIMSTDHYKQSGVWSAIQDTADLTFTAMFTAEAAIKLIAYGPKGYFRQTWNRFDFAILLLSWAGAVALEVGGVRCVDASVSVWRILRLARLLRLVKWARGITMLLKTLYLALPLMLNVTCILALFFTVYGAVGVRIFGRASRGGGITQNTNFEYFPYAVVTLIRAATGEGWHNLLAAYRRTDPECDDHLGGCVNPAVAIVFWVTFETLAVYILLNLFIAVILDAFEEVIKEARFEGELRRADMRQFKQAWKARDKGKTFRIDAAELPSLLKEVGPPLGVPHTMELHEVWGVVAGLDLYATDGYLDMQTVLQALFARLHGSLEDLRLPDVIVQTVAMKADLRFQAAQRNRLHQKQGARTLPIHVVVGVVKAQATARGMLVRQRIRRNYRTQHTRRSFLYADDGSDVEMVPAENLSFASGADAVVVLE